jgi:hypothetical protein
MVVIRPLSLALAGILGTLFFKIYLAVHGLLLYTFWLGMLVKGFK